MDWIRCLSQRPNIPQPRRQMNAYRAETKYTYTSKKKKSLETVVKEKPLWL